MLVIFRERLAQSCEFFPLLGQGMGHKHNYGSAERQSIDETERGLVFCSTGNGGGALLFWQPESVCAPIVLACGPA
jgi:hypothetical protein